MRVTTDSISTLLIIIALATSLGGEARADIESSEIQTGVRATNKKESFSFVVWGHPRGRTDGDPPLFFEEILSRIRELKPDALFITGDVISGGASRSKPFNPDIIRMDWERFDAGVKQLGVPVYHTPGNHDVNNFATRDIYLERYRKPPFAVTIKGSRFVLLDTVGIEQRSQDAGRYWDYQGLPLDSMQIEFIRSEMAKQESYNHIFFFMHHTRPWADQSGYWWKDVHPMLKGGRTRAVFSGDPYRGKYGYVKQDDIIYIQSAIYESAPIDWFRLNRDKKSAWAMFKQFDNLQYVRVEGDKVAIQTIVIGAMSAEGSSIRYWDKVNASYQWTQRLPELFYERFHRLRHLVILGVIWGGASVIIGILVTNLWLRRRRKL